MLAADPKPMKRFRASQRQWRDIRRTHFEHACCINCGLRTESLHHIIPRSQGGDDVVPNLAPLCGTGTTGCHGLLHGGSNDDKQRVVAAIRKYVTENSDRVKYVMGRLGLGNMEIGWARFDHRYPPPDWEAS